MALTIGVCSVHLSAAPQSRVEVAGSAGFLYGDDFTRTKFITVGAAGRIYWNDRWSFAPEFEHIRGNRGVGEFVSAEIRGFQFNPFVAVDLNASDRFRPYLVGGAGLIRDTPGRFSAGTSRARIHRFSPGSTRCAMASTSDLAQARACF